MRLLLILTILIVLTSCSEKREDVQTQIFSSVINDVFEYITRDITNLQDYNEVVVNPFNDHLDSLALEHVKSDTSRKIHPENLELILSLEKILNEPLTVDLRSISRGKKFALISERPAVENYDFDKEEFIGSSFISNVAIDVINETGVFYIDFQFGKVHGAGGFLFFVKKVKNEWEVFDVWQLWE